MIDPERLRRQMEFCLEIDKEKFIGRQTYLSDGIRKENDAEHAWHLALMALILSEYANEDIDLLKTMTLVLIHDLVEVYAGDTYAYDTEAAKTQAARELQAADQLFSILPPDQGKKIFDLWQEFEAAETPESKFAHTLDNLQPTMLNAATGGKAWKQRGIKVSQVLKRNARTHEGSEALWDYSREQLIRPHVQGGQLVSDEEF